MDIKGAVTNASEWLVANGSWLFPITLLLLSFFLRWGWGRSFSKMNFFKLIIVFPIDIKITACTFVLAAMLLNPNDPFGFGYILISGIVLLSASIGFYNHFKIESMEQCDKKHINYYFIAAMFSSILMLVFSILIMQAYENKDTSSSQNEAITAIPENKGKNND